MKLVCSTTANYFDKILPYLLSVNAYSQIQAVLFCVDCKPPSGYMDKIPNVQWVTINGDENEGAPESTRSIQHGSFLFLLGAADDETIIYTDGDMIMQRPFSQLEMVMLRNYPHDTVGTSWNSGPHETLITEAARLKPQVSTQELAKVFGDMIACKPCFNIGVLVATARTWRNLYEGYMTRWQDACNLFEHRARQQWLMCQQIHAQYMTYDILPYSFHTHAHYGLPAGVYQHNGVACHDDKVILFRHRF